MGNLIICFDKYRRGCVHIFDKLIASDKQMRQRTFVDAVDNLFIRKETARSSTGARVENADGSELRKRCGIFMERNNSLLRAVVNGEYAMSLLRQKIVASLCVDLPLASVFRSNCYGRSLAAVGSSTAVGLLSVVAIFSAFSVFSRVQKSNIKY